MSYRTTILLDDETREAARELAYRLNCSTSEAIRRAILRYRQMTAGATPERRRQRVKALEKLIALSEGLDAEAELERLKSEDDGF